MERIRLELKHQNTKQHLLQNGIFLEQMLYQCVNALPCIKCQFLSEHIVFKCENNLRYKISAQNIVHYYQVHYHALSRPMIQLPQSTGLLPENAPIHMPETPPFEE